MVDPFTMLVAGAAFKYTRDYLNQRAAREQRAHRAINRPQSPPQLASSTDWREASEPDDSSSVSTTSDDGWCSRCNRSNYDVFEQDWLEDPKTMFRIIELEPGEGDEPVVLKLVDGSIHSAEDYEALSYRWEDIKEGEDPALMPHVHSSGGRGIFPVSYSVLLALLRLRYPQRTRRLWIDQLCIVQKDDISTATTEAEKEKRRRAAAEKSSQLRIMGTIYKNATQAIIWLGPDSKPNELSACTIIESLEALRIQMEKYIEQELRSHIRNGEVDMMSASEIEANQFMRLCYMTRLTSEQLREKGITEEGKLSPLNDDAIKNIIEFYQREWFSRTWPVQEVVLSKHKVVLCGDNIELSWKQVGWFADYFSEKYKHLDYSSNETNGIEGAKYMYYYSSTYTKGFPLAVMLRATRRFKTGDPKDKVYALLGMVDFNLKSNSKPYNLRLGVIERVPDQIPVDSSKDFEPKDLYHEVAKYFLQKDQSLEILSSREHVFTWEPLPRPSWVPRWDVQEQNQQVWIPGAADSDNFAANSDLDPSISFSTVTVSGTTFRTCNVRGIEVDLLETTHYLPLFLGWKGLAAEIGLLVSEDRKSRPFDWKHGIVAELAMALTAGRWQLGSVVPTAASRNLTTEQYEHIDEFISFVLDLADHTANDEFSQLSKESFRAFVAHVTTINHKPREKNGLKSEYAVRCQEALRNRSIFRTRSGKLVVGPVAAKVGDQVVVLKGGRVPFVLRKVAADSDERKAGSHQLVGECYCYGLMNGEAFSGEAYFNRPDLFTLV